MLFRSSSSSSYLCVSVWVSDNNFANLSLDWPYCVQCTLHNKQQQQQQTGMWKKKWHENVRSQSHTTINKYFMLALLCSFPFFCSSSFSSHTSCSSSSAGEYTALFQNLKHLFLYRKYTTYAMGSNWKWGKKRRTTKCADIH